jgi:hypothetical protein
MMTAVGMVRAGLGITILPASAHEIRAELVARAIDDSCFVRPIAVVRKRRCTLPPAAENFMKALVEYIGVPKFEPRGRNRLHVSQRDDGLPNINARKRYSNKRVVVVPLQRR